MRTRPSTRPSTRAAGLLSGALLTAALVTTAFLATALRGAAPGDERDRGDVPGWVLVTVMTAGIVVALAAVAGPALTEMFTAAISAVTLP